MIGWDQAIRAVGIMPLISPFSLVIWIVLRMKLRQIQRQVNEIPHAAYELARYRRASYIVLLVFLASLLFWVGPVAAVQFNWKRNDVSEISIQVFRSPYPQVNPEHIVSVTDKHVLSRVFDELESLHAYDSGGHNHNVGESYVLSLRRQSDGKWSNYRIKIFPDMPCRKALQI
ncbi:hypothetical protein HED60_05440 [Planctomycetales bacterium ZRK34]|nr:hypothetical protein HED60_05440 [Planctomycetales bacterium ZRK34]